VKNLFSIKDKIIIVTGGGSGLGEIISTGLVSEGAVVYCFDIKFKQKIEKNENRIFQIKCDITNSKKFENQCKKIFLKHKRIDSLLNIAGVGIKDNSQFYSMKNWMKTISINLTAVFDCSQIVIKYMSKNNKGSIVNFTSINAEMAFPKNPAYVASKGGLKMLGKSLAKDWAVKGIRVNNIGPGYFRTNMTEKSYNNKKLRKEREMRTMLGRWGNKEELIGPCIFLISDSSSYITGQDIYVDGGWLTNGLSEK
jgi:NAD(P)-dependent dehydrogenase (short-subunit alcohol dehydrogenase family)